MNHIDTKQYIADGAILHCWCWSFRTIAEKLEEIAAAGFRAIQTSPINACLAGERGGMQLFGKGKWFYHYQPTDFKIGNYQLGSRDEFRAMCAKAASLGVEVIADVVPNHTTFFKQAVSRDLIDAVGGRNKLYHHNRGKKVRNFGDRLECTFCNSLSLPDIDTENHAFQDYFIAFLHDCIACGASGFRFDSAKHIALPDDPQYSPDVENDFWPRVIGAIRSAGSCFNYGEVLHGENDRLEDYIRTIGAVTASRCGVNVRDGLSKHDLRRVEDLMVGAVERCVTWVESHDSFAGSTDEGTWATLDNRQLVEGWAIIAARAKGTPLFFSRPFGSAPHNQWGTLNRIGAAGDPLYRDAAVIAVNRFRTAMIGEPERFSNPGVNAALQIGRGRRGAVIVNTGSALKVDFATDLADGSYLDRVDGRTVYTAKNGRLRCASPIGAHSVVVLYLDDDPTRSVK